VAAGIDARAGSESLAAAVDAVIVATSSLVVTLAETGGPQEQRIAAQLAAALVALATARGCLAPELDAALPEPISTSLRVPRCDRG
jgi:hypothetical protein